MFRAVPYACVGVFGPRLYFQYDWQLTDEFGWPYEKSIAKPGHAQSTAIASKRLHSAYGMNDQAAAEPIQPAAAATPNARVSRSRRQCACVYIEIIAKTFTSSILTHILN